jgi:hypothetical protein
MVEFNDIQNCVWISTSNNSCIKLLFPN